MNDNNLFWQRSTVTRTGREQMNGHRAFVIWFTGLSGAGKSSLAYALEDALHQQGRRTLVLDGDNIRQGLCADLSFSAEDRHENLRRVAELARLTVEAGVITLAAFISPLEDDRAMVRDIIGPDNLCEIYVQCPLEVCEDRDVKGLYQKARRGEIHNFTGISSPYEAPKAAQLALDTSALSIEQSIARCLQLVQPRLALQQTHQFY